MASAAENFRSTCGPERGPPECSTQASPAAAPQVGQGTTEICSEVSSFFFIGTACENIGRETVQFCTLFVIRRCLSVPPGKYGGADSTPPTEISPTSQSCPLLHRFSGPSFGSIDMESQQGIELRVPPQKPNEV
jgi:hypothetical protein